MTAKDVLRIYSSGLLSKWGFNDGDMPEEVCEYCEALAIDYGLIDWHATLVRLVCADLLPALKENVEIYEIETIHNPIRAHTVNGERVDVLNDGVLPSLTPEYVEIPMARVVELAVR